MDIFISWSGARSKGCAEALREWLPCVVQTVKPWCSSEDIAKGARGDQEIIQKLGQANFGIVCLTSSNLQSEWIHYESGALSKHLEKSAIFTFILDLQPADIKPPLGWFQHTRNTKEELRKLIESINSKSEMPLAPNILSNTFEAFWPQLQTALANLPPDLTASPPSRSDREILEEILQSVRGQAQSNADEGEIEIQKRRALALHAFADGVLKGRKVEAKLTSSYTESEVILTLVSDRMKYLLTIQAQNKFAEAKKDVVDFIVAHTISDDDIPF